MKKLLIAFVLMFSISFLFSQETFKYKYVLKFPTYATKDIKPLVAKIKPLFQSNTTVKNNDYSVYYYQSNEVIEESDVLYALKDSKYQLLVFEIIENKY